MERMQRTWLVEIILAAVLAALVGLVAWTATEVVQVGETVLEAKAELQQQIAENRREIAEINSKMDLIISGLNISIAPKESASAEPEAARGLRAGAGEAAGEQGQLATR